MSDFDFIHQTLDLAAQGRGLVGPRALVGALVVKDSKVVGLGGYRYNEMKHAEIRALEDAGHYAFGATLYVNLEPCSYEGGQKRTAACVHAIIKAGIKRVVAAMTDPNPQVSGRGFEILRAAGIEVINGLLESEACRLNEKFIKYITTGKPFVNLKIACSLDGRIATWTGESKWITGEAARNATHELRFEYDSILVGIGTVLADDPLLTDRTGNARHHPLTRIVLDSNLRLPLESQLVKTAADLPLIVFTNARSKDKQKLLERCGVTVLMIEEDKGHLNLQQVLTEMGRRQITSLLVEGGAEVAGSFVENHLIDKATFFLAPKLIGGRAAIPAIGGVGFGNLSDVLQLRDLTIKHHGNDIELTGYPELC